MDLDRTDCIKSYFQIVALVNGGNRIINEQTEAKFFIADGVLYLGVNERQKLRLVYRKKYWMQSGTSGHEIFEKFVCKILNNAKIISGDVDRLIKSELFKLPN